MFPRNSPFDQMTGKGYELADPFVVHDIVPHREAKKPPPTPTWEGPSRAELERWYRVLTEYPFDNKNELADLRDDIYSYLY